MMRCLVFPYECADGPANMAFDEAMLDAAAADPSCAYFRTYGWSVPTLSLGYFQRLAEADVDPRWRSVPKVRRPTGGGALWHDAEVTYAVAIPREHPLARESRSLYRAVHEAIARSLRFEQVEASRRGESPDARIQESRPFLCFTGHDAEDIVSQGAKLVGSAQRRRVGAVLQHGALLLRRTPLTPELAGVNDFAPASRDWTFWCNELERRIPESLGLDSVAGPVPASLIERAKVLEETVYRSAQWTARR